MLTTLHYYLFIENDSRKSSTLACEMSLLGINLYVKFSLRTSETLCELNVYLLRELVIWLS